MKDKSYSNSCKFNNNFCTAFLSKNLLLSLVVLAISSLLCDVAGYQIQDLNIQSTQYDRIWVLLGQIFVYLN